MKKNLALTLALVMTLSMLLSACGEKPVTVGEYTLAATPQPELLAQTEDVLSRYITCYEENDAAGATDLFLAESNATEEDISEFFANVHGMSENPYVPYNLYYMKNLPKTDSNVKVKKSAEDKNYIELYPETSELFCAQYVSEAPLASRMMTFILAPENGEFKIQFATSPAIFKFNGKDAPALYEDTKKLQSEGKLVAAYINSCMLGSILRPGGYYKYENDLEMEDLCYQLYLKVTDELALPLSLEGTANSSLLQVDFVFDEELGAIPYMIFRTDVNTSDTAALTAEAEKVLAALEKLSPGIRESFNFIRMAGTNDDLDKNSTSASLKTVTLKLK